jgi:hypothetical protein
MRRRQLIDYFGTRPSEGQVPYLPRGFSRPWDNDNLIDYFGTRPSEGQVPYLPRGFFLVHETTTIDRLLRYSTFGGTSSLPPKRIFSSMRRRQLINYFGTRPSEGQVPYLPRGFSSSIRRQLIDYFDTRPMKTQDLYSPSRNYHSRRQKLIDYYSTRTSSPFRKKDPFVHETPSKSTTTVLEETTQRQPMTKLHEKVACQSAVN